MADAPLSPLPQDAFDGYREEASIHRDLPIPKNCTHKAVQIVSSTELRCGCGAGWQGPDILRLYKALKNS